MRHAAFPPCWDASCEILILGSFPSVKSRAEGFYYGHPQNRFWRTLAGAFGEPVPRDIPAKKRLLLSHRVALWDMAASCEVAGSMDADLRRIRTVDLRPLMAAAPIRRILLNGRKAEALFLAHFPQWASLARYLPSTSPANPRFDPAAWRAALREGENGN
jgi:hypoxanthine-DNA glycosylase